MRGTATRLTCTSADLAAQISFTEDVSKRFESLGWHVLHVKDGNTDIDALRKAVEEVGGQAGVEAGGGAALPVMMRGGRAARWRRGSAAAVALAAAGPCVRPLLRPRRRPRR